MLDIREAIIEARRLEVKVRDHINTHRHQVALLKDSSTWNQICSSLDVIGDTLFAISSLKLPPFFGQWLSKDLSA